MQIPFFKYQGTGNDFVMIDNREGIFNPQDLDLVRHLCDRKFGIGADGLILLQNVSELDFEMVFFNPDGTRSLCGNGSRCAVKFASRLGIIDNEARFLTIDGPLAAQITDQGIVVEMKDVTKVEFIGDDIFIFNGSPHYVRFEEQVSEIDVLHQAHEIRFNPQFKEDGTNVNFVQILSGHEIFNRTYERGVEAETLSCGTGVIASSIASSFRTVQSPVKVQTPGGQLLVAFTTRDQHTFSNIKLTGPATMVFEGLIQV